jgi:hypothetical protein
MISFIFIAFLLWKCLSWSATGAHAVMARDELLWALHARIASLRVTGDRDAVLAPEALGLARALIACVPDPSRDREAARAVADFYRIRSLLLGGDGGGPDATIAAALTRLAGGGAGPQSSQPSSAFPQPLLDKHRRAIELYKSAAHDPEPLALAEALRAARAAVDATPPELAQLRAPALGNLGSALCLRYEQTGSLADLHEAVRVLRQAAAAAVSTHPDLAAISSALGVALRTRFERAGALEDLEESIMLARQAADATPDGDFNHGGRLHNLGIALRLRYERSGPERDLDEAIGVCREAVSVTPPGHPGYARFRSGLGNALSERYDRRRDALDLGELVTLNEQAVEATPPGHELRPGMLVNLASSLSRRYEADGRGTDSGRAEALLREAIAALPDGHFFLAGVHYQLGLVLRARHSTLGRPGDLDAAVALARTAALQPTGSPRTRLWSATAWGRWAMTAGDPRLAVDGYAQAISLLPAITPRNLAGGDAESALTSFSGLACDAAACAIAAGDAGRAVTLLEQGRGVLLGQRLQSLDDATELREQAPELAARFAELRAALDAGDVAGDTAGIGETAADVRHVLASEWDQLLARVRALPGFAHFLRPPPLARLLEQAAQGPVVLVNVSRHRCDALLLTSSGLRVEPLPQLTLEGAVQQAVGFLTALEQLTDPMDAHPTRQQRHENALAATLAWLWDTVAGPVLDALSIAGPPAPDSDWPRVWWIPTGPLAFLPLHAAGHHHAADGRSVLDRAVSSYAPTVRALAHARRPAPSGRTGYLVVAVPDAPGASPLPGTAAEAATLTAMLPGARLLLGAAATRDAVLTAIQSHGWLHFSGHGSADPASPSMSQLIVHDYASHPLTVADVSRLNLPAAELAYLSACTTARTGFGLPDEALHLAGGLQLAGYRHVVGTLWEIDDAMAVLIAERVYAGLGAPQPTADLAADAVHAAVREVRERHPATPSLWAAHLHVGA